MSSLFESGEADRQLAILDVLRRDPIALQRLAGRVALTLRNAYEAGSYVLPRSADYIAGQLADGTGTALLAHDANGELDFHYYRGVLPLVRAECIAEYPVYEGGSLVANPERRRLPGWERYHASDVIRLSYRRMAQEHPDALIISTSRATPSKRALSGAGAVVLRRERFPGLDALTCDPGCLPSPEGPVAGIHTVATTDCGECIACPVNVAYGGAQLADGCYLYANDADRAIQIEERLRRDFGGALGVREQLLD